MSGITVYKGKDPEIVDFIITVDHAIASFITKNEALSVTIYNTNSRNEYIEGDTPVLEMGTYTMFIEKVGANVNPKYPPTAIINF
jgi:hypothetical protein